MSQQDQPRNLVGRNVATFPRPHRLRDEAVFLRYKGSVGVSYESHTGILAAVVLGSLAGAALPQEDPFLSPSRKADLLASAQLLFPDEDLSTRVMYTSYSGSPEILNIALYLFPYTTNEGLALGRIVSCTVSELRPDECGHATVGQAEYLPLNGQAFPVRVPDAVTAQTAMSFVDEVRAAAAADPEIGPYLKNHQLYIHRLILRRKGDPLIIAAIPEVGHVTATPNESGALELNLTPVQR